MTQDRRPGKSAKNALWVSGLIVVACAGAGGLAGVLRTPSYTSGLDVIVGAGGLDTSSAPGYVQATQTLAAGYSRAVARPSVTDRVAKQVGLSSEQVAQRLTASPVPDSAVIRLESSADSPEQAIALANKGGEAFVASVDAQLASTTSLVPLTDVQAAELAVLDAQKKLSRTLRSTRSDQDPRVLDARAALIAQRTRAQTISNLYASTRQPSAVVGLEVIRPATTAASDRKKQFVLFVLLGGLLGSVIALASRQRLVSRSTIVG